MATGFPLTPLPRLLGLGLLVLAVISLPGRAPSEDKARRIGLIFEGAFESPEISRKPEGARSTLLVPFHEWDYGVRPIPSKLWKERGFEWDRFVEISRAIADGILEKVEPRVVRDSRGIVEYVDLSDKDPFLTSILLSDKLLDRFRETLGDRVFAVLVDRHRVYLFPATGGDINDYGPGIVDEYRATEFPVSLEVFLIDDDGYRVVGELNRETGN